MDEALCIWSSPAPGFSHDLEGWMEVWKDGIGEGYWDGSMIGCHRWMRLIGDILVIGSNWCKGLIGARD
jgi:hypothetical protein